MAPVPPSSAGLYHALAPASVAALRNLCEKSLSVIAASFGLNGLCETSLNFRLPASYKRA
jgi:hypothetical protein